MKLKDKVTVITGGVRDIGKSISLKLAAESTKLVINFRADPEQAEHALAEITAAGGQGILVQGDMTKEEDVLRLVRKSMCLLTLPVAWLLEKLLMKWMKTSSIK